MLMYNTEKREKCIQNYTGLLDIDACDRDGYIDRE